MFFGHLPELALILVGALIIFGPKRLPEVGSALGQGIRDFKRGVSEIAELPASHPLPDPVPSPVTDDVTPAVR